MVFTEQCTKHPPSNHTGFQSDTRRQGRTIQSGAPGVGLDSFYQGVWDSSTETQWGCLARIIRERDPQTIGYHGDGAGSTIVL